MSSSTNTKKQKKIFSSSKNIIGNYRIEKTLGEGTFGKVKLATHIPTSQQVAIKILEKDKIIDKDDLDRISREINFLKKLHHPNIIKIYDIIENHNNYYIIMELCSNGELFSFIVKNKRLNEKIAQKFYAQILCGLEAIHKNLIVHRDIKPENLLLKNDNILAIIDFGLSNEYKKNSLLKTPCGSPCYAAPEMILNHKYKGIDVDLWSSGIVLYAMVCGYLPFEDKDNDKLYRKILNGKFEIPGYLSENCVDLIKKILTVNPKKRIKFEEVKNHVWIKDAYFEYVKSIENYDNNYYKNYNEEIIDKMIKEFPNFGFKKGEIIFNLSHNKHNNITTTYELLVKKYYKNEEDNRKESEDVSLNTATNSPHKNSIDDNNDNNNNKNHVNFNNINNKNNSKNNNKNNMKNNNNKSNKSNSHNKNNNNSNNHKNNNNSNNNNNNNSNNKNNNNNIIFKKKNISKKKEDNSKNNSPFKIRTERNKYNNKTYNINNISFNDNNNNNIYSHFKTIENNSNNNSNIDIMNNLDIRKVIKKNKIDSNIILGVPKFNNINRKIFNNIHKLKKQNNNNNKNKNINNNNNNIKDINTSITYEFSPGKLEYHSNNNNNNKNNNNNIKIKKDKKLLYIPSNTIYLYDDVDNNSIINVNNYQPIKKISTFKNSYKCKLKNEKNIQRSQSNSNKNYCSNNKNNNNNSNSNIYSEDHFLNQTITNRSKYSSNSLNNSNSKYENNLNNKNEISFSKKNYLNKFISNNKNTKLININNINNINNNKSPEKNKIKHIYTSSNHKNNYKNVLNKNNNNFDNNNNNNFINKRPTSPVNLINKNKHKIPNKINIDISIKNNNNNNNNISECKNNYNNKRRYTFNKNSSNNYNRNNNNNNKNSLKNSFNNINNNTSNKNNNNNNNEIIDLSPSSFNKEEKDMKKRLINSSKDFALCTTNSSLDEIYLKLQNLCKEEKYSLTKINEFKYICKKDSDNSINIEVNIVNKSNVLKLYHLNGKEKVTKEIIKKIIINIGF